MAQAPTKRDRIRSRPRRKCRVVRRPHPFLKRERIEENLVAATTVARFDLVDNQTAGSHHFAIRGEGHGGVVNDITGFCDLNLEIKRDTAAAFHINAYNALSIYKVIETGIPETNAGLRKVFFFAFGKVQVGGQPVSLYDYENKVIRPLGDPRIHMALNCMSVSCLRLPREPFLPETLDQQLERETKYFFSEPRNLKIDTVNKVVTTSEILKFFPEDFLLTAPSLIALINRYRAGASAKIPEDFRVDDFPYDWTINRQPGG